MNNQNNKEKTIYEHFQAASSSPVVVGGSLVTLIISIFAVYLSYRCNGNKFKLGSLLLAWFCSPFYILFKHNIDSII